MSHLLIPYIFHFAFIRYTLISQREFIKQIFSVFVKTMQICLYLHAFIKNNQGVFMSADTAQRVISVIAKFKKISEDKVTLDTSLEELGLDSLDGLNLIFELEEEFNVTIPDDKALMMKTVKEMVEGMEKLLAGEAPAASGGGRKLK
jgi:acyl carrier protein